jgi:hypothetical protein
VERRDMKSDVTFGEPPPAKPQPRYDWAKIADKLRDQPGEWALIFEDDLLSLVTSFRLGGYRHMKPDEFEYRTTNTTRGVTKREAEERGIEPEPRRCDLWMRYVGPTKKGRK